MQFTKSKQFKTAMKYLYGWGASVVIIGAMFKINHFSGAREMLIVGLSLEALIFFVSVWQDEGSEYKWERVYPALKTPQDQAKTVPLEDFEACLREKAGIDDSTWEKLGSGMKHLGDQASKLGEVADVAAATQDYGDAMLKASNRVNELTGTLEQNKQLFDGMGDLVSNLNDSVEETKNYKENITELSKNLAQLNTVYGNMLNAMGGGRS
jgi:gliding motility-associated protein GldL